MVFGFGKKKKKTPANVRTVGPTTTSKTTKTNDRTKIKLGKTTKERGKERETKRNRNMFEKITESKPYKFVSSLIGADTGKKISAELDKPYGERSSEAVYNAGLAAILPAGKVTKGALKGTGIAAKSKTLFSKGVPKSAEEAKKVGLNVVNSLKKIGKSGKPLDLTKTYIDVNAIAKSRGLSSKQTRTLAREVAKRRVNQVVDSTIGGRYPTNSKIWGLTKKSLVAGGISLFVIDKVMDAFGTWPWASHNTFEARTALTIGMRDALKFGDDTGDYTEYDKLTAELKEVTENRELDTWIDKLPYYNVAKASKEGIAAAALVGESLDRQREAELPTVMDQIKDRDIQQKQEQEERDQDFKDEQDKRDKRQDERDQDFKDDQAKRDKEFEDRRIADDAKYEKLRVESKARDLEDAKFYDAIRKRNAGLELTDEEIALLEKRGASTEAITTKTRRRSRVQF